MDYFVHVGQGHAIRDQNIIYYVPRTTVLFGCQPLPGTVQPPLSMNWTHRDATHTHGFRCSSSKRSYTRLDLFPFKIIQIFKFFKDTINCSHFFSIFSLHVTSQYGIRKTSLPPKLQPSRSLLFSELIFRSIFHNHLKIWEILQFKFNEIEGVFELVNEKCLTRASMISKNKEYSMIVWGLQHMYTFSIVLWLFSRYFTYKYFYLQYIFHVCIFSRVQDFMLQEHSHTLVIMSTKMKINKLVTS